MKRRRVIAISIYHGAQKYTALMAVYYPMLLAWLRKREARKWRGVLGTWQWPAGDAAYGNARSYASCRGAKRAGY